jgi:hypothetical protein|uniref:Zipper dimerization domain transcription factor-like protein n=1 Tax=Siphoviridae sp. ctrAf3 TaxID=2825687 RepID=A0A8S5PTU5_9CAUD|nr:MAG TPA: zipper dimerization domain transcription factor-like protein [Siphoviridae sp. ctrAf3]DAK15183.1 MAG TPA: zipper dimerization domain transcription factor-like protein [Caudoviricetes sp.]DAT67744.1 MAG TPA: zipper dimerization domain transcription factor-like protein [Caudoviricetes sp.]
MINRELLKFPEQLIAYLRKLELRVDELEKELKAIKIKQGG